MGIVGTGMLGLNPHLLRRLLGACPTWQWLTSDDGLASIHLVEGDDRPDQVALEDEEEEPDPTDETVRPRAIVGHANWTRRRLAYGATFGHEGTELSLALEFSPIQPGRMFDGDHWDEDQWDAGFWDDNEIEIDDDGVANIHDEEQQALNLLGAILREMEERQGTDIEGGAATTHLNMLEWTFEAPLHRANPQKNAGREFFAVGIVVRCN